MADYVFVHTDKSSPTSKHTLPEIIDLYDFPIILTVDPEGHGHILFHVIDYMTINALKIYGDSRTLILDVLKDPLY